MSQTDKRRLCWRFLTLVVLCGVLILLTTEQKVMAVGECAACDTQINSCYNACRQHEIQMQQTDPNYTDPACYATCRSNPNPLPGQQQGFSECIWSACFGMITPVERTSCQMRSNSVLNYCRNGNVVAYQTSYDACIQLGDSVDDCCSLIADMKYDSCCQTSYCPP